MNNKIKTKDPVNQSLITLEDEKGLEKIGLMNSAVWHDAVSYTHLTLPTIYSV